MSKHRLIGLLICVLLVGAGVTAYAIRQRALHPEISSGSTAVVGPANPTGAEIGSEAELKTAIQAMRREGGLVLPRRVFLVAGIPLGIYLRTIVPVYDPEVFEYTAECTCGFASLERRRVLLSPGEGS